MLLIRQLLKMKNGCKLTKNRRNTVHISVITANYSTKQNGNVTMTFPVNLSLQCFRTAALLMVMLNMESRKPIGSVYPENLSKMQKPLGVKGLTCTDNTQNLTD